MKQTSNKQRAALGILLWFCGLDWIIINTRLICSKLLKLFLLQQTHTYSVFHDCVCLKTSRCLWLFSSHESLLFTHQIFTHAQWFLIGCSRTKDQASLREKKRWTKGCTQHRLVQCVPYVCVCISTSLSFPPTDDDYTDTYNAAYAVINSGEICIRCKSCVTL